jgi:Na+-driven multidrug efflux pump
MSAPPPDNEAAPAARERFWPRVREAIGGSRRDLTVMPLNRAILLLAIPMVLEMAAESLFAVAAFVLARPLGLGSSRIHLSIAVAFSLVAVVSVVLFRRGRWKTVRL